MFFFNCIVLQQNTIIKYLFYSINMMDFTQKKHQYEKNFSHIQKKKYKKNIKIKLIILPVCLL